MENKAVTSTYAAILVMTVIALAIIKFFNISYPLAVTSYSSTSELSVTGEGKIDVVPDTAVVEVGVVVNNAETAKGAKDELTKINNEILASLKKMGVQKESVKTTNISVYPNYSYNGSVSDIVGYNGNANLSVKVSPDKASQVVDISTQAGANEVRGPNFSVENPDTYREQARNKAIQNAKEQAQKLASRLGIKLGKVVNIVESTSTSGGIYPATYSMAKEGMGGGGSPSYEPGSQTVSSVVTLYFEKKWHGQ